VGLSNFAVFRTVQDCSGLFDCRILRCLWTVQIVEFCGVQDCSDCRILRCLWDCSGIMNFAVFRIQDCSGLSVIAEFCGVCRGLFKIVEFCSVQIVQDCSDCRILRGVPCGIVQGMSRIVEFWWCSGIVQGLSCMFRIALEFAVFSTVQDCRICGVRDCSGLSPHVRTRARMHRPNSAPRITAPHRPHRPPRPHRPGTAPPSARPHVLVNFVVFDSLDCWFCGVLGMSLDEIG
jgi:hypothetical protein